MIRLGHIVYSNCFPIHASLIEQPPAGLEITSDIPSALNRMLAEGRIDIAPCSSIEYARNADRYRILPSVVIGSRGPVQSILLESSRPISELDGAVIAATDASATSVVLMRILLEIRFGVKPRLVRFTQSPELDPIAAGAAATLWIGDTALRRQFPPRREVYDLGELWTEWTDLPFAFALWQTSLGADHDAELLALLQAFEESRRTSLQNALPLAQRNVERFGIEPNRLARYWESLQYDLDHAMLSGVKRFYEFAADLGECPRVDRLRIVGEGSHSAAT